MKQIAKPHAVIVIQVLLSVQSIMVVQSAHGHGQTVQTTPEVEHAARTVVRHVIKNKTIKIPRIIWGFFLPKK